MKAWQKITGMIGGGLLIGMGLVACVSTATQASAPEPLTYRPVTLSAPNSPTPAAPQAVPIETAAEGGPPVVERVEDYGQFPQTVSEPTGPLNLLPPSDPLLVEARIRGIQWPMVANSGTSRVFPSQKGLVSFYHEDEKVATGEDYNPLSLTAAHKSLPFGTIVRVRRVDTGQSVIVMINDRGPYIRGRILDLSKAAARELGLIREGITRCMIEVLAYPLIETMGPKGNG